MHKKLTVQPWNVVQVHNVRVDTVSEMSTSVDFTLLKRWILSWDCKENVYWGRFKSEAAICQKVETVSGMSTRVDINGTCKSFRLKL